MNKKLYKQYMSDILFWKEITQGKLDEKDIMIYLLLRYNGRLSDAKIARMLGLSPSTIRRRRIHMQKEGYLKILGIIIFQYTGISYADVVVSFDPKYTYEKFKEFVEEAKNNPRIYEVTLYAEKGKILLRFFGEDVKHMSQHILQFLSNRPFIKDYEVYIVTESPKLFIIPMKKGIDMAEVPAQK